MTTYSKIVMGIGAFIILTIFVYSMLYKGSIIVVTNPTATSTPVEIATTTPPKATATTSKPVIQEEKTSPVTTLSIGESKTIAGIEITPLKIVEDSRCPIGVQCIQAGKVRVEVKTKVATIENTHTITIGEPIITDNGTITLVSVTPIPVSGVEVKTTDYRLTFNVTTDKFTYKNASADNIKVTSPFPGAVINRNFKIKGSARGPWFFEASSRVVVFDKTGDKIAESIGRPEGNALTEDFVPYSADVAISGAYAGPATIVLSNDNPSGLPENDSSISFPVTIAE